jgi:hypothetical protein
MPPVTLCHPTQFEETRVIIWPHVPPLIESNVHLVSVSLVKRLAKMLQVDIPHATVQLQHLPEGVIDWQRLFEGSLGSHPIQNLLQDHQHSSAFIMI